MKSKNSTPYIKPCVHKNDRFLICCDLDGTLLNSAVELSKRTITGIKRISDLGHIVCLVTGRPIRGSIDIYNSLDLKTVMVNQNGSFISKPHDPNFIPIAMGFDNNILKDIFSNEILRKYMNNALIEGINKGWLWKEANDLFSIEKMMDIFHLKDRDITTVNEDLQKINTDISSILIHVDNLNNFNSIIYEIKNIASTLVVRTWSLYHTDGVIIEINTHFASKKTALKFLGSYYGIPKERHISFGDGDNDIDMLASSTWGFAMKNGSPAAILAARYITKYTNDDNGVISELYRFFRVR